MTQGVLNEIRDFCLNLLEDAGNIAVKGYGRGNREFKFDNDLVTSMEMEIEGFLRSSIEKHFPEARIFEEGIEHSDYKHGESSMLWVFDALDGVANYQAGIPLWGMSIALVENFWPVFGAYYMPSTADMFWAFADGPVYHNGTQLDLIEFLPPNNESLLFTYSRFHDHFVTTFPGKIRNLGCTGAHVCYVAKGRADGAVLHNVAFRDLLAPFIILQAADGSFEYVEGGRFNINDFLDGKRVKEFLLATRKGEHEQLRNYLKRTDVSAY